LPPPAQNDRALTRAIFMMAMTAFASGFSLRVSDPLLPQIAADFGTSVGRASAIVTAYAVPYGLTQAFSGILGDRFGKCQAVAVMCAVSCVLVLACALSQSLTQLTLARLICAPAAAMIVPLGMAYVGDVVPYEGRQPVLARFLAGQMMGTITGQVAAGIIGDHFGWRSVFYFLALVFALAGAGLALQLAGNPWMKPIHRPAEHKIGMIAEYAKLVASPWARFLCIAAFVEGLIFFGSFTYVAADLHNRLALSFSTAGVIVAGWGVGAVLYAATVHWLVRALGEVGLVLSGGIVVMLAYLALAATPFWEIAPLTTLALGLGYYLVHNTLQTNATQMLPEARGTAVAGFSSALFLGQSAGVALAAPVVDRAGAPTVFVIAAIAWPVMAFWILRQLPRRP
jgi:predicted MFS family arabinose efflux permease